MTSTLLRSQDIYITARNRNPVLTAVMLVFMEAFNE